MSDYRVTTFTDTFEMIELIEQSTSSRVSICPERGGIVTGFKARGAELLYLDETTFYDPEENIRGGIPILFPICGQLTNGSYEWNGRTYNMKNHGVARNDRWEVIATNEEGHASATLRLTSNSLTRDSFPFDFELIFTYILKDAELHIVQEYRNRSENDMPMYAGFHPYFRAETKDIAYETDARTYLDYNDNKIKAYTGSLNLDDMIESPALLDASAREISFLPSACRRIRMKYSDVFKYVVLWSIQGKPFVCVEPWMALPGEMHRKQELMLVKPHDTLRAELTITLEN